MPAPTTQKPGFGYFGVAKQSAVGTAVAPSKYAPWKAQSGKALIKGQVVGDGTQRDQTLDFKFSQLWQGSITTYLFPDLGLFLLGSALSGADTTSGGADPYSHSISSNPYSLWPLTVEQAPGSVAPGDYFDVFRVADCYPTSVKLTQDGDKEPDLQFSFLGRTHTPQTPASVPAFESDRALVIADSAFTYTGGGFSGNTTHFSADIQNAIGQVPRGDNVLPLLIPGERKIMLDMDVAVTDNKLMRNIMYGSDTGTVTSALLNTITSIQVKWDLGGTPDHFLQVLINRIKVLDGEYTWAFDGKVCLVKGVKGTATSTSGTPAMTVSGQNGVIGAYFT